MQDLLERQQGLVGASFAPRGVAVRPGPQPAPAAECISRRTGKASPMDVLLIGGGGREHALAWKLAASPSVGRLFASPGSDAIAQYATCLPLDGNDAIVAFARQAGIGLTVIGPEAPLVGGLVDALTAAGLPAFGPTAAAAALEGSKGFSKDFMARHGIPTAPYATFDDAQAALAYLETAAYPLVVKADGLAAGKGVVICQAREAARQAVSAAMVEQAFGAAGSRVVIEGFLPGEECSYFAICDGQDFIAFPAAQDHKPIGELDRGPNTGGMGAYCPAPILTPALEAEVVERVVRPTLRGMAAEGHPFRGVLYVGLMIDGDNIQVLEYNCRFGDPECQPLMLMLESDLGEILLAAAQGGIARVTPRWRRGAAACIVMASGGYPGKPETGHPISGLGDVPGSDTLQVFHAGTARRDESWIATGGRVLGVTAWGPRLGDALDSGYRAVHRIAWQGMQYRRDIGLKGLRRQRSARPAVNAAIVTTPHTPNGAARTVTDLLRRVGVGYREVTLGELPLRRLVDSCEDAGAEVFVVLGTDTDPQARELASLAAGPVVCLASPDNGAAPSWPAAMARDPAGTALLAAQILALQYPDVRAALQEHRIEQALPVAQSHPAGNASTP